MRIAFFPADHSGCGYYRMRLPAKILADRGHEVTVMTNFMLVDQSYDVYVFQRVANRTVLDLAVSLKAKGKLVVHDLDDAIDCIPEWSPAKMAPDLISITLGMMRVASVCTFSTKELASRYKYLNENQVVLENCLDLREYYHEKPNRHMPITVGWAGTATHHGDLDLLKGILETIISRHKETVFVFVNAPHGYFSCNRVIYLPGTTMADYPEMLASFDIGLIPLQDHPFNDAKSDIKGLEYGARGIPFVASPAAPYKRLKTGLLAPKPRHWVSHISRLISEPELRAQVGAEARKTTEGRDIHDNIHKWEAIYEQHDAKRLATA